jgi:nucleoside 2-deoxyribosyltransferase
MEQETLRAHPRSKGPQRRTTGNRPSVYLAGPITGLTFDEAITWREPVVDELYLAGIDAYSPLRFKTYLREFGTLESQYQGVHPLSNDRGIVARDYNDCANRDMILVNLLGAERISVGTVWEIGVGYANRRPIVIAMEEGNAHEHAMINESAGFIVRSLEEAVEIVKAVLLP